MYDPYMVPETRRPRRARRPRRNGLGWVVALVATVPVIVVGFHLAHSGPSHLATSADAQGLPSQAGGWGHGGYPMMPGTGSGYGSGSGPGLGPDNAADALSANWAGYATAQSQGSLTAVSASWAEPAVTCTDAQSFSAFWVGLDGDGTPTVEQTGTEADCVDGTPSYQGWYELFPNAPVFFSNPVQPADEMTASVVSDGNGIFTLKLADATQGWTQSSQQSDPDAVLGSAEIIAEAPSDGQQVLPLADFGTVDFTNATINNQALGSVGNLTAITMADNNTTLAAPSALTGSNAFGVTENSSDPASGQGSGGQGSGGQGGSGTGGQGWSDGNGNGTGGQGWSAGNGGGGGWDGWGVTGYGN